MTNISNGARSHSLVSEKIESDIFCVLNELLNRTHYMEQWVKAFVCQRNCETFVSPKKEI